MTGDDRTSARARERPPETESAHRSVHGNAALAGGVPLCIALHAHVPPARTRLSAQGRGGADRRGARRDPGDERDGRDRHALRGRRLVQGPDKRPGDPVQGDEHRAHLHHRRGLRSRQAGLGPGDRTSPRPGHHRVDPHRPRRHRGCLQSGGRRRCRAGLHGQRAGRLRAGRRLRQRGVGRQLRERGGFGAPHGRQAGRAGQGRRRLPQRRLLRHAAAVGLGRDSPGATSRLPASAV